MIYQSGRYPGVYSMKPLGVFLLPQDEMLAHYRVTFYSIIMFTSTHLRTWTERGAVRASVFLKTTIQCPLPGLEPRLLNPEVCYYITGLPLILSFCLPVLIYTPAWREAL